MKKFLLPLLCFALLGIVAFASAPGPGYHVLMTVPLVAAPGGGEDFDYITVDSAARRVYLAHGAEVKVLDADTFSVVGAISDLKGCHGVLVLPELGKGFVTDGDAASVAVFDLKTLKITRTIKSSPDTDSIIYDPASKLVFTFNGESKNATVIDPVKETVVKVIDLGGSVEYPVADGKGNIYDDNEVKNDVAVIDTHSLTVKARWPVAPAGAPAGMEMDREHRRLFASGRDPQFLVMMNADSGKIIQSLPISGGVDGSVYEAATALLFAFLFVPVADCAPDRSFHLMETSIADIHKAMLAGTLTCHDLVQQYLDRIHAYDQQGPAVKSMLYINPRSLQEADAMDQEFKRTHNLKPLGCIPIVLKDNF